MLINGRYLSRAATGVDRFANELLRGVAAGLQPGQVLRVATPAAAALQATDVPYAAELVPIGPGRGQWWEQLTLPAAAGDAALINLCTSAPALRENQLVAIHDAATFANPANFSAAFRTWYAVLLRSIASRARVVATVSRFSADELTRHLGVPASRLEIIGEGGEHILRTPADPSILERLGLGDQPYVLAVGSQSPNKNLRAVIDAMALLGDRKIRLVAAGGSNARIFADTVGADSAVLRTGYVSDAQLRALYERAACFVFPSFYEGFGLPPLEAMCCDCPVIVANRSSLPEVCADAALYCDPADPASLAAALRRLLDSAALRDELRQAGRRRVAHFGWQRAATQFVDVVRGRFEVDLPAWRSEVAA